MFSFYFVSFFLSVTICFLFMLLIDFKGAFTPMLFGLVKTDPSAFAWLVRFI